MKPHMQEREQPSFSQVECSAAINNSAPRPNEESNILPAMTRRMLPPKQSLPGDSARLSYMWE
jgi:hypothetical protein